MMFLLHLVILLFSFSCKAEVNQTYLTGFPNITILTEVNSTSNIWGLNWPDAYNVTPSMNSARKSVHKDLLVPESTKSTTALLKMVAESTNMTTTMQKMAPKSTKMTTMQKTAPYTTNKSRWITSRSVANHITNTPCVCKNDQYKTGVMICAIIIAVLVLICAALIICSVALANKVSSLKTKLTQSKRQARSNGDFLNASSILWPSGMETWQKKLQTANQTMDEISLGEHSDETHTLMTVSSIDKSKDTTADIKTSSNNETITIVSTVEV